ncbi:hypothetical protein [Bilophila wadsworthia]|uniref:hypothetical protein n=1 Tax=Bilophila wadsworthia TaxID=35833 RepID=UPI002844B811|nr:hypothetical protein [Bilophila sp.]
MHISTVRIRSVETASGFIVINEADFDPSKHQLWNSEVTAATPEPSSAEPNANKPLDLMTLAELRDHAKAHGIAIPATITAKADVLAHVLAASPGKWLLSELTRGYKGTTAASGASGAAVSLKSRAFVQALCRPNVSAWIVIDKTLQAVQGCHVTDASISVTKEGAVELTGTLTGCRAFNAGPSSVAAEAQTSVHRRRGRESVFRGAENPEHHQVGRQFRQGLRRDRRGRTDEHTDRRARHLRRMGRG